MSDFNIIKTIQLPQKNIYYFIILYIVFLKKKERSFQYLREMSCHKAGGAHQSEQTYNRVSHPGVTGGHQMLHMV